MDTFQTPNRGLKEYVEDSDDKLTFGIVYSSQVDTDFNLPYIFPIGECSILIHFDIYVYSRNRFILTISFMKKL